MEKEKLLKQIVKLEEALRFYADPETYLGIAFFGDPPCGEFLDDFSETNVQLGSKPGKLARETLASIFELDNETDLLNPTNRACETCAHLTCDSDEYGSFPECTENYMLDGTESNHFGLRYNCPKWHKSE